MPAKNDQQVLVPVMWDFDLNSSPPNEVAILQPGVSQQHQSPQQCAIANKYRNIEEITLWMMVEQFGQPLREAANNLNVSWSALKKRPRKFGIGRWPNERFKNPLHKLLTELLAKATQKDFEDGTVYALQKKKELVERELSRKKSRAGRQIILYMFYNKLSPLYFYKGIETI